MFVAKKKHRIVILPSNPDQTKKKLDAGAVIGILLFGAAMFFLGWVIVCGSWDFGTLSQGVR